MLQGVCTEARADAPVLIDALTARETEILALMAGGFSNREIADALGPSESTIKNHVCSILSKLVFETGRAQCCGHWSLVISSPMKRNRRCEAAPSRAARLGRHR